MKIPVPKPLRKYVIHSTDWRGYWSIVASCEIKPNTGGFASSYDRNYYCREIGGISLLHMPIIVKAYRDGGEIDSDWFQVFSFRKPFSIMLAMLPEQLSSRLKLPDASAANLGSAIRPIINPGEICHIGPISISLIERVYISFSYGSIIDVTEERFSKEKMVYAANELKSKVPASRTPKSLRSFVARFTDVHPTQFTVEMLDKA